MTQLTRKTQNTVESILNWFKTAKPKPTRQNLSTQAGCHIEEFAEMVEALGHTGYAKQLQSFAMRYKQGEERIGFANKEQKLALADSLADQIVTAIGTAYMANIDIIGALREVDRSNWSKFEDDKPVLDANGKIIKGKNYSKPNLNQFV